MSTRSSDIFDNKWSSGEKILLVELAKNGLSFVEIKRTFDELGYDRSYDAIRTKFRRLQNKVRGKLKAKQKPSRRKRKKKNTKAGIKPPEFVVDMNDFEKEENNVVCMNIAALNKVKQLKKKYQGLKYKTIGILPEGAARKKIVSISDLHVPFEREDLINKVINEHKDADVLVVNGDFLEIYAVSTWAKNKEVILQYEYDIALQYLEYFSSVFPHVVLVRGNHERRINKFFASYVSPVISFLVDKEILNRLAAGERYDDFGNVIERRPFENVHYEGGPNAWYVQIGKTIFLHPEQSSSVDGRMAVKAQEYFMSREDVDCLVVGHTHKIATIPRRGKLCMEQGCLCCPLDYEKEGKFSHTVRTLGYAVIWQDKRGNCDFNKSKVVYLGVQEVVKPSILLGG